MPNKIAIIGGAGGVGSTMAFYLGLKDVAPEIAIIDVRANVLETHLVDLRECFGEECSTKISAGDMSLLAGSDLVIMAAATPELPVASRNDYLAQNLKLSIDAALAIKERCPHAATIVATAPTDVFVMVFNDFLSGDRRNILGFCRNDSQRFRWALSKVLKIDQKRIGGLVLGEHGASQAPLFSSVTVDGEFRLLKTEQKKMVIGLLNDWYGHWQAQKSGRATTWLSATSMCRTIQSMYGQSDETLMGSAILRGEYGLDGVALGTPLIPGPLGWSKIKEIPLSLEESIALRRSAESVKSLYEDAKALYPRFVRDF
jgi:L-lactate dehydrogenase/malate dehydrogenase